MARAAATTELLISARDETQRAIKSAKNGLDSFATAAQRTARYRGLVENQTATADAARQAAVELRQSGLAASGAQVKGFRAASAAAKQAALEVTDFRRALVESRNNTNAVAQGVDRFARALSLAAANQARLNRISAAEDGFARTARGAIQAEAAIENETIALNANTAALGRNASAARAQGAAKMAGPGPGGIAGRVEGAYTSRQGRGPLGLRPHELANLSYQANDIATGLAMGQAPMQIFAQQAGQIAQIFPGLISGFVRLAPVIGLVTAALSPFISAMSKANAEAATLKDFDLLLTRSGNAAAYTAPQLAAVARNLDTYAGSLTDARAALTEFVGDAVASDYLERFGRVALDFAKVMKVDVTDAAKTVSDAFTGNADAILSLDDELNFLTASERAQIKVLREQKKDAEARTMAFAIFERKYGETAAKMRGPWSQILNDFGAAWNRFVDIVNFIDFAKARRQIDDLVQRIQRLTALLPGANKSSLEASRATFLRNFQEIERIEDAQAGATAGPGGNRAALAAQARRLALLRRENAGLRTTIAIQAASEPGQGLLGPPAAAPDTTFAPPPPANTGNGGRDRVTDAERLAEAQAEFVKGLLTENAARTFALSLVGQQERAAKIAEAINAAELAAAEVRRELLPEQRAEIERTVGALHDAEVSQRAFDEVSKAAIELAIARGEVETRNAFIARNLAEEGLTAELALYAVRADQLGQEYDLAEAARKRAAAEKTVNDLMALRTVLQEREIYLRDTGQGAAADAVATQVESINQQLVAAIDNAIAMWRALGGPEAEIAIAALQTARDGATGLGMAAIVSGRQINDMMAQGATNAFDQFAQSLAAGQNAIKSLGDAFRSFAADFLRQIANMILQQIFLNALQSMGGGKGGAGGGIAGFISSTFGAIKRHSGGLVGSAGRVSVPSAIFANAGRMHTGGIAGIKPNEVPAILERGEEVLTADDPRHRGNGGMGGSGTSVKVVNVLDPSDILDRALGSDSGERIFLNFVRRNPGAFKAAMA